MDEYFYYILSAYAICFFITTLFGIISWKQLANKEKKLAKIESAKKTDLEELR